MSINQIVDVIRRCTRKTWVHPLSQQKHWVWYDHQGRVAAHVHQRKGSVGGVAGVVVNESSVEQLCSDECYKLLKVQSENHYEP